MKSAEIRIDNVIAEGPATSGIEIGKTVKSFISSSSIILDMFLSFMSFF